VKKEQLEQENCVVIEMITEEEASALEKWWPSRHEGDVGSVLRHDHGRAERVQSFAAIKRRRGFGCRIVCGGRGVPLERERVGHDACDAILDCVSCQ